MLLGWYATTLVTLHTSSCVPSLSHCWADRSQMGGGVAQADKSRAKPVSVRAVYVFLVVIVSLHVCVYLKSYLKYYLLLLSITLYNLKYYLKEAKAYYNKRVGYLSSAKLVGVRDIVSLHK